MSYIPPAKPWTTETAIETWRWVSRSLKTSGLVETTGSWKCFWLDTLFSVAVMVGRGTDKCPWDRADGKTDILHAAVKGPRGAESSQGHAFMLGMRAKCAETRCKWQRPPSPASGPHSIPREPAPTSQVGQVQPLQNEEMRGSAPSSLPSRWWNPHTVFLVPSCRKKTVNGADFWRSGHLPQEIKKRDYLNTGRWTLNWKEAVKTRRYGAIWWTSISFLRLHRGLSS